MPRSHIAEDVAIESTAESLGVELTPEAFETKASREATETALTELASARLTTPEYLTKMQEIANQTSKALAELAKASGSKEAHDLVTRFDEQIKGGVSSLAEGLIGRISSRENFGQDFEKICSGTQGILEDCMNLGGGSKKDEDKDEEPKKNAEMKKLMLLAAIAIAALFVAYFGIPLQTVILAGVAFKAFSESKEKNPIKMAKSFADRIVNDDEYRDKALEVASLACPGLSALGLGASAASAAGAAIGGAKAASELLTRSKAMLAAIPKSPEQMQAEVFKGLESVIDKRLEEKPELRDKLKELLERVKSREATGILSSLSDLATKGIEERGLAGKASDLLSGTQGINDLIGKFTKLAKSELALTPAEQVFVEKVGKEMKEFVAKKYVKPVHEFCEAAKKAGAAELASRLGLSKSVIERVSSSNSQIARSEPSVGRTR